jgi:iron(III) transport system ATP-binding protein
LSNITISGLSKRFAGKSPTVAIDDLHVVVEPGEFLVLLGPSGCGKTTTLRCIAGLETAEEGSIAIGEHTVFDGAAAVNVGPNKRNIGMVFQSYALWPHMTVRKNIGYPLRARGVKKEVASEWIEEMAALVDCSNLLDRHPAQLSGGQQQRIALARGLVGRPTVMLFDEPLSNLDARLRDIVRTEIHSLHGKLGFTAVYVTHDQSEALALGDRVAIMRSGALEQLGTPEDVFEQPATEYVADFIGMANRIVLERDGKAWTHNGVELTGGVDGLGSVEGRVVVRVRREAVDVLPMDAPLPADSLGIQGTVTDTEFGGLHLDVAIDLGPERVTARVPGAARGTWARSLAEGDAVRVAVRLRDAACFDAGGALVSSLERPRAGV